MVIATPTRFFITVNCLISTDGPVMRVYLIKGSDTYQDQWCSVAAGEMTKRVRAMSCPCGIKLLHTSPGSSMSAIMGTAHQCSIW
jgi:hypothetical protein